MKNVLVVFFLAQGISSFSQIYLLPTEKLIFSFDTKNGKKICLATDKENKYIIYRFGTKTNIEFEFPGKSKDSWKNFKYSFYLRGGGAQNEGMDLNYIYFINKNYEYVIYDTYYAADEKRKIGIKITDLTTKKITNIQGKLNTQKGNLTDFRDNHLLEIGDEIFD